MFDTSTFPPDAGAAEGVFGALRRRAALALAAYRDRRTLRDLGTLDPHLLADIGVTRGDIDRARKAGLRG